MVAVAVEEQWVEAALPMVSSVRRRVVGDVDRVVGVEPPLEHHLLGQIEHRP
jgi:hypothetical protein